MPSFCILSTYPPTQCGLAGFSASLLQALTEPDSTDTVHVVPVVDSHIRSPRPEVVEYLRNGDPEGPARAAEALNRHDVAIVQHEYGIYAGPDGDAVLAVLDLVRVPIIVVMHTVLSSPTARQKAVLEQVAAAATAVVTMTQTARQRLIDGYDVDESKLSVIPHGAVELPARHRFETEPNPIILTWGLLGPGKGIEWALIGMREVRALLPQPRYIVAGQTHPKVRALEGEAYRLKLGTRIRALRLNDLVRFERGFLDDRQLATLISRADVVLLPYDSHEQVTSGVLVEAIAAHKPVVATPFPHAVELLSSGAGLLVPHRDGPAIGAALKAILTQPELADRMQTEAARIIPQVRWPAVADRYRSLASQLLGSTSAVTG